MVVINILVSSMAKELWILFLYNINRVYTVRENQGKTYLFRDGQGKSGKVREFNEKVRENLEKVREIFLESSYLL